ncbi:MAG TPA: class I SAM-dependent methyltransferase [Chthoniobacteraceae bacterium]|nr:class I SAM-dependent methyltransferase [Chthoniobacteraceae bacterium]
MTAPNATATTEDFEFAALEQARNYRSAIVEEFGPMLRGNVLEIGAGIGQMTTVFRQLPGVSRLLSVEPDPAFARKFRETHPAAELIEGTIEQTPAGIAWDGVVSINVLEHIHGDEAELARYAAALRARHGALCLLVPARPEIYAPIDKDFGHFRRYTLPELRGKLGRAGFQVERLHYYNWVGYFAWWFNFCLLKRRSFTVAKVVAYDRAIFPLVHAMESKFMRPPFGQSLLAVARA